MLRSFELVTHKIADKTKNMTNQNCDRPKSSVGLLEVAVFLLIIGVGIGSRFWLVDLPNFKPVAALCLFGGFFFRRYAVAALAAVLILMISDLQLGGYQWQLAACVYSSMILAGGIGWLIKTRIASSGIGLNRFQITGFVGGSLAMSTVFFVLTNAAVWQFSGWYGSDLASGLACFASALPFYRWTILGDMTFTLLIVGVYQTCAVAVANYLSLPQTA